jgi:hypothetical protein
MRIWHLMALVFFVAAVLAVLHGVPELGVLVLLDVTTVVGAFALVRNEPKIRRLWAWATRRGGEPRHLRQTMSLASCAFVVTIYQLVTSLALATAVVLVAVTAIAAVVVGTMAMVGRG